MSAGAEMSLVSAWRQLIDGYAQEVSSRRKDRQNRTHVDHSLTRCSCNSSARKTGHSVWSKAESSWRIVSKFVKNNEFYQFKKSLKFVKKSFLLISSKHKTITFLLQFWGFIVTEFVSLKIYASRPITMLIYSITVCIKDSRPISSFSRYQILFFYSLAVLKFVKIREFYEILQFI